MVARCLDCLQQRNPASQQKFYDLGKAALKCFLEAGLNTRFPQHFAALKAYWGALLIIEFNALHAIFPDLGEVYKIMRSQLPLCLDVVLGDKLMKVKDQGPGTWSPYAAEVCSGKKSVSIQR